MGWLDEPKIMVVGFETIRSSTTKLTKFLQKKVMKMIIEDKTFEDLRKILVNESMKIQNNKCSIVELGIPSVINQLEYKVNLPRVRGMEWSNKNLNTDYGVGDKPLMLYVKSKDNSTDAILFEFDYQFTEAQKLGIKLDKWKMIERIIFMPLKTIFSAINWNLKNIQDEVKLKLDGQKTLF